MKRIPVEKIFLMLLGLWLAGISGCGDSQVNIIISPRTATIARDQPFPFTVQVSNTQDTAVIWSIDNNSNGSLGSIDPDLGTYTPPAVIPTPNIATVRVTSQADSSITDSVTVALVSANTLRFGTNIPVTDYSNPPAPSIACTPGNDCAASTQSSGQHSVKVFRFSNSDMGITYDNTIIYTVWSDNRYGSYDVFFRQVTLKVPLPTTPSAPPNPPTLPIPISNTYRINDSFSGSADPADPSLAIDSSGNVYVAWRGGTAMDHDIYVNKGTFNITPTSLDPSLNVTFTTPVRFSDDSGACDQTAPAIATDGGSVYVAWGDNRTGTPSVCSVSYTIRAAAGPPPPTPPAIPAPLPSASSALPRVNSTENQAEPSIGLFGGNLYVAWTGAQSFGSNIYFTRGTVPVNSITPDSASWTVNPPIPVNDDPGITDHAHPSLVVDSTGSTNNLGNVYVAWEDNRDGNYNIYFAKMKNGGTMFDAVTDPNNPNKHNIRVNDDTIANGFLDTADHRRPSIVVEQSEPNATANTPNKIYVVWDDTRYGSLDVITAKSLDGGNTFWTNSAPANLPPGDKSAYDASIAVDTLGRAYIIWTDERNNAGAASDVFFAIGQ